MKKWLFTLFFCILTLSLFTSCTENGKLKSNSDNFFKKNHIVTLVINDSYYNTIPISVDDGDAVIIDFTPRKNNYFFKGWYTDSACELPYDLSRPVTTNFKLYAGFALKTKTINCQDVKIKALSSTYDNDESFGLSLVGFDYDYLEKNGMGLQFKITYNVKYKKDYNFLFDIGYAGSPKYELSLINRSLSGYFEKDLPTTATETKKIYTYNTLLTFSKDTQIRLVFSTDNIQNIISFSNIVVVIEAIKLL